MSDVTFVGRRQVEEIVCLSTELTVTVMTTLIGNLLTTVLCIFICTQQSVDDCLLSFSRTMLNALTVVPFVTRCYSLGGSRCTFFSGRGSKLWSRSGMILSSMEEMLTFLLHLHSPTRGRIGIFVPPGMLVSQAVVTWLYVLVLHNIMSRAGSGEKEVSLWTFVTFSNMTPRQRKQSNILVTIFYRGDLLSV